jgi:YesN/AraC family two-component response regulator
MKNDAIKIILADNRASNRRGLKALLAFEPRIEIIGEAGNGKEAVELTDASPPDLVLMDIHMPVLDGLGATQAIKSAHPDVRVVLYSVYPGYEQESILAGADCFLVKGNPNANPTEIILSFFPPIDPASV